jgi:hypothetical protein
MLIAIMIVFLQKWKTQQFHGWMDGYLNRLSIDVDWNVTPHAFKAEARGFDKSYMIILEKAPCCKTSSNPNGIRT